MIKNSKVQCKICNGIGLIKKERVLCSDCSKCKNEKCVNNTEAKVYIPYETCETCDGLGELEKSI